MSSARRGRSPSRDSINRSPSRERVATVRGVQFIPQTFAEAEAEYERMKDSVQNRLLEENERLKCDDPVLLTEFNQQMKTLLVLMNRENVVLILKSQINNIFLRK